MSEIPAVMKASVLLEPGKIVIEERPVPTPGTGEVLIKVGSVGVCGSDVEYYRSGRIGGYVLERPMILGHEAGGQIVAVGDGVSPARVGERVSIEPQRPCRKCSYCKSGRYNLCPEMEFYATPPFDGAFCEYVTIEDDFAFRIPDNISDDTAALIEPLSVGIAAVQRGGVKPGDTVVVAGAGPIGIIAAQVAKAYGATDVVVADPSAGRREKALKYGATRVYDPEAEEYEGVQGDVFIDASGAPSAIEGGVWHTKAGGVLMLVGSADTVPMSVSGISMREVDVRGMFRYTNTWPIALDLLSSGLVELDSLVTGTYGLEQVEEALVAPADSTTMKRIVRPGVSRM